MWHKIVTLFRSVNKNKPILTVNILGLAIGLATTILLLLFIMHERSYDRYFANAGNIYRLHTIWSEGDNKTIEPIGLREAYTEIPTDVAGIKSAVQIYRGNNVELSFTDIRFTDNNLLYVDSTFLKIFDFKCIKGSLEHALDNPNSIVLTKTLSAKIFGDDNAVGKTLVMGDNSYTVTAVTSDIPANTHFSFDLLIPMNSLESLPWLQGLEFFTYYLFDPNTDPKTVSDAIRKAYTGMLTEGFDDFNADFDAEIVQLKNLHLFSRTSYDLMPQGSINTVILVGIIAALVMFLALTNFINLFIISGEQRAKELGVRKVNGAGKTAIVKQFFSETSLIVAISFIIGILLAVILLPQFGNIMQRRFDIGVFRSHVLILSLISIFIFTVILSGSYPALYLSRFNPVSIFRPQQGNMSRKKILVNISGGLQLMITLFLLSYMFGIDHQIRHLKNLSSGLNPDGVVNISNLNDNLKRQYPAIKDQLLSIPEIEGVAASSHTIGGGSSGQGIRLLEDSPDKMFSINEYRVQPGLCKLMEMELKEGRFFDPERATDKNGVILNEAAVRMLGLKTTVNRKVVMFEEPMEVIGVVKDFRYESAANIIKPLVITDYSQDMWSIAVRINTLADRASTMNKISLTLRSFDDGYILSASNTADIYNNYYVEEERLEQLVRLGAALAIVIVMMGIFMLISQTVAGRKKEIGIRKVLGGSTSGIVKLLYGNSFKWTVIASIIAIPASYWALHIWLQNFAVKAPIKWWLFALGIVIVLVLETLIMFGQTWRAATRNPVEALRYE